MKNQLVAKNNNFGLEQRHLTTRNIAQALLGIMKDHIGEENHIYKHNLFKKIFQKDCNETDIRDWLRWEFVKRAMHYCRVRTDCFIGSRNHDGHWSYFVLKDRLDASYYCDTLENAMKKMRQMQVRALVSIRQEWYKREWKLPEQKRKLLV